MDSFPRGMPTSRRVLILREVEDEDGYSVLEVGQGKYCDHWISGWVEFNGENVYDWSSESSGFIAWRESVSIYADDVK